jgi:hypothetical protein
MKVYWIVYSDSSYLPDCICSPLCVSFIPFLFLFFLLILFILSLLLFVLKFYFLPRSLTSSYFPSFIVWSWVVIPCRLRNWPVSQHTYFSLEDGSSTFLRYVVTLQQGHTVTQLGRPQSNHCHEDLRNCLLLLHYYYYYWIELNYCFVCLFAYFLA